MSSHDTLPVKVKPVDLHPVSDVLASSITTAQWLQLLFIAVIAIGFYITHRLSKARDKENFNKSFVKELSDRASKDIDDLTHEISKKNENNIAIKDNQRQMVLSRIQRIGTVIGYMEDNAEIKDKRISKVFSKFHRGVSESITPNECIKSDDMVKIQSEAAEVRNALLVEAFSFIKN